MDTAIVRGPGEDRGGTKWNPHLGEQAVLKGARENGQRPTCSAEKLVLNGLAAGGGGIGVWFEDQRWVTPCTWRRENGSSWLRVWYR